MEIVVPVREQDDSNSDEVRLAIAAILLNENATVDRLKVEVRYRLSDGAVRFMQFGDQDVIA
jgi:hypothetical protein